MLVINVIYILCFVFFAVSIFNLTYSIINKNKILSKYIIILAVIFIIYSIFDVLYLPNILNLDVGLELLIYYGILLFSGALFITSIIIAATRSNKLNIINNSIKIKIIFIVLILFPIVMFCISYFKEMHYINNSKLVIICSEGEGFSEYNYAYAIGDDYSEIISIGAEFRGAFMKQHLPSSFEELSYTWTSDNIEINDDNIIIYRDNKIIYKLDVEATGSYCDVEEVFYRK